MFHIIYIAALTKNLNDPKIVCPCFSYYYLFENFWFMLLTGQPGFGIPGPPGLPGLSGKL